LLANGSERVVEAARDRLYDIRKLENFAYTDPKTMKNHGVNVVEKSRKICGLIADDEELREVRQKAKTNKDKSVSVLAFLGRSTICNEWNFRV
jgi:epsin